MISRKLWPVEVKNMLEVILDFEIARSLKYNVRQYPTNNFGAGDYWRIYRRLHSKMCIGSWKHSKLKCSSLYFEYFYFSCIYPKSSPAPMETKLS